MSADKQTEMDGSLTQIQEATLVGIFKTYTALQRDGKANTFHLRRRKTLIDISVIDNDDRSSFTFGSDKSDVEALRDKGYINIIKVGKIPTPYGNIPYKVSLTKKGIELQRTMQKFAKI